MKIKNVAIAGATADAGSSTCATLPGATKNLKENAMRSALFAATLAAALTAIGGLGLTPGASAAGQSPSGWPYPGPYDAPRIHCVAGGYDDISRPVNCRDHFANGGSETGPDLRNITWSTYGHRRAVGTGWVEGLRVRHPSTIKGHPYGKVRLRFDRPRYQSAFESPSGWTFTRSRYRLPGSTHWIKARQVVKATTA